MSKYVFKLLMAISVFTSFSAFAAKPPALEVYKTNPELIGFYVGDIKGKEISFYVSQTNVALGMYSITAYNIVKSGDEYTMQYTTAGNAPELVDENGNCENEFSTPYKNYCFFTVIIKPIGKDKLSIAQINEEPVIFTKTTLDSNVTANSR